MKCPTADTVPTCSQWRISDYNSENLLSYKYKALFSKPEWLLPFQKDLYFTGAIIKNTHGNVQGTGKGRERKLIFICGMNSDSPEVTASGEAVYEATWPSWVAKLVCMADYPGYLEARPCSCKECALSTLEDCLCSIKKSSGRKQTVVNGHSGN